MTSADGGVPGDGAGEVYRQQVLVAPGGLANVIQHGDQHIYQGSSRTVNQTPPPSPPVTVGITATITAA